MSDSVLTTLGLVVGVALLFLASRIRSKARSRPRPPVGAPPQDPPE
jgi:hypothetical protein